MKSASTVCLPLNHPWDVSPQEAVALQEQLRAQIVCQDKFGSVNTVGGIDVGYMDGGKNACAAIIVLSFPDLKLREISRASQAVRFPYIPGLLSFREAPVILEALSQLSSLPDLLLCDGHGLAHPRRFGLACHVGLLSGLPSIGVAKKLLTGAYDPLAAARGSWQPLIEGGEVIGAALRTQPGVKPVFVSIGHRLCLQTAIDYVLRLTTRYRLPDPIHQAHHYASLPSPQAI